MGVSSFFSCFSESVKEYYGKILSNTSSLKTSACVPSSRPHPIILRALQQVPEGVKEKYYGCGSAVPLGIEGLHVLDLGSGSGQDCFVASVLVGPKGSVIGVDMTEEQLQVARGHIEEFQRSLSFSPRLEFRQGFIEDLRACNIDDATLDLVISNCVVNLSPRKDLVLQEAYRVLRHGGEFFFSDVYCDRRLPESVRSHKLLWGECIAGAMYVNDFVTLCRQVGFADARQVETHPIFIGDDELEEVVGNAKFFSITFRLFKLPIGRLEPNCEDYGQVAVYKGNIAGHSHKYILDDEHTFESGKPTLVCGNTASMLEETWLRPYFTVTGNRDVHYGLFPCGSSKSSQDQPATPTACAPGGSCC